MDEASFKTPKTGRAVPLAALPQGAREGVIAALKGRGPAPVATQLDVTKIELAFALAASVFVLGPALGGALQSDHNPLSPGAPFRVVGGFSAGDLPFVIPIALGFWGTFTALRFVWSRVIATASPGAYLFGGGVLALSRRGVLRVIPAEMLSAPALVAVRARTTSNSDRSSYKLVLRGSGEAFEFSMTDRPTGERALAALQSAQQQAAAARAAGDLATLARVDPFEFFRQPGTWDALSPTLPPAPGASVRGVPGILRHGAVFGAVVALPLVALMLGRQRAREEENYVEHARRYAREQRDLRMVDSYLASGETRFRDEMTALRGGAVPAANGPTDESGALPANRPVSTPAAPGLDAWIAAAAAERYGVRTYGVTVQPDELAAMDAAFRAHARPRGARWNSLALSEGMDRLSMQSFGPEVEGFNRALAAAGASARLDAHTEALPSRTTPTGTGVVFARSYAPAGAWTPVGRAPYRFCDLVITLRVTFYRRGGSPVTITHTETAHGVSPNDDSLWTRRSVYARLKESVDPRFDAWFRGLIVASRP